jgi:hypothetical protein
MIRLNSGEFLDLEVRASLTMGRSLLSCQPWRRHFKLSSVLYRKVAATFVANVYRSLLSACDTVGHMPQQKWGPQQKCPAEPAMPPRSAELSSLADSAQ